MKNFWLLLILAIICFSGCETESLGKADPSKVIQVDSELYNLIEKAAGNDFENEITCIDFNYAFTLVIYNEEMDIIGYQVIKSDLEFSEFLTTLEESQSISLSYPITSVLESGESYVINNNEELKEAIDRCIEADTVTTCNNILTKTTCIWHITHLEGPNSHYDGAYFQVCATGNVGLNYKDNAYGGTWVTYFIEDELHLNIFVIGDQTVSDHWNFDWKVVSFDVTQMEITNGIDRFLLTKECAEPCKQFLFEECEIRPDSQTAVFDLESYFDCFFPLTQIEDPSTVEIHYFETYENMMTGTNPIQNLLYINSINPQVIYIRFDDVNTGEMVAFLPIILKVINC
ncbi:hypothetical protein [Aequorivita flava]|uniref:Uncharacterized protein n=1 Tax=Aequorivita flava TaxID=3114371 RepID=A0AB35YTT6_9FLAO